MKDLKKQLFYQLTPIDNKLKAKKFISELTDKENWQLYKDNYFSFNDKVLKDIAIFYGLHFETLYKECKNKYFEYCEQLI